MFKKIIKGICILADFITVGLFAYSAGNWAFNTILCNPYSRIVLCSILLTVLVFVIDPVFKRYNIINKNFKVISYTLILVMGVVIIFLLPKGSCEIQTEGTKKINSTSTESTKADTVTKIVHDTIKEAASLASIKKVKKEQPQMVKNVQKVDSASSGIQNNGINNGQQAGRDINNNNYGIQPRKMNPFEIMNLMNTYFPNKNTKIYFVSFNGGADAETVSVKNQITSILREHGYTNIEETFHITVGITPPDRIMFDSTKGNPNLLQIEIPPAH